MLYEGPVHQSSLQPLITIVVLIAGVVGGLVLVISVILFCKYCFKKKKVLKRQPAVFSKNSPERTFIPLPKFDSIDSISESQVLYIDNDKTSHDELLEEGMAGQDDDENIDIAVARYQESLKAENQSQISQISDVSLSQLDMDSRRDSSQYTSSSRRDSRTTVVCVDDDKSSQGSRYTDGDYHHLKKMRIEKGPSLSQLVRQCSVGVPATIYQDRHIGDRYTRSMTDDPSMFNDSYCDVHIDPSTPMLPNVQQEALSPVPKGTKTEVRADVHCISNSNSSLGSIRSKTSNASQSSKMKPTRQQNENGVFPIENHMVVRSTPANRHSVSMETVSPVDSNDIYPRDSARKRRVKSYDGGLCAYEFDNKLNKGPFYNADYDVVSEGGGSPCLSRSKVRYNDTGSKEDVNSDAAVEMLDEIVIEAMSLTGSDDTETLNGSQKYRELWNLRTTFEEEEDISDTIQMEDTASPDQSPDREIATTSYTTSFESNTEPMTFQEESDHVMSDQQADSPGEFSKYNLLHPNYEARRQTYTSILSKRLKKFEVKTSTENSFDSVETMDTDGEVSDTSRPVDTTTSFESTTDNTDSTGDSQTHKLQQMKADSGYKSLETNKPPKLSKKQIHFALDTGSYEQEEEEYDVQSSVDKSPDAAALPTLAIASKRSKSVKPGSHFDRRNGKTASKKRREYRAERQIIHVYESINEPETDSKSEPPSGDSFEENSAPSKFSVFSRFFKSHSLTRELKPRTLPRDYSIDSKSDALFNEFSRVEPELKGNKENKLEIRSRSPRSRPRLHRKHTEPGEIYRFKRDKLAPEMRSTSLGSDSSCASSRRLSPQDSIEEEFVPNEPHRVWGNTRPAIDIDGSTSHTVTIHEIPIICLPEEELVPDI
ncbi:uncharacterized protein LOC141898968 [Tubulanus polymorphus]|uniref:uncharacterized protein LOC141898968 n=1 Tax=Tubulanus polymorphus TaxID=672921 RepID=UPI003DA6556B